MLRQVAGWLTLMATGIGFWLTTALAARPTWAPFWFGWVVVVFGAVLVFVGLIGLSHEVWLWATRRTISAADIRQAHSLVGRLHSDTRSMRTEVAAMPDMRWMPERGRHMAAAEELVGRARVVVRAWYDGDAEAFDGISRIDQTGDASQWRVQEQLRRAEEYLAGLQARPPTSKPRR